MSDCFLTRKLLGDTVLSSWSFCGLKLLLWPGKTNWVRTFPPSWGPSTSTQPSRGPDPPWPPTSTTFEGDASSSATGATAREAEGSTPRALDELSWCWRLGSTETPVPCIVRAVRVPKASGVTVCTSSRLRVPCWGRTSPTVPSRPWWGAISPLAARMRGSTTLANAVPVPVPRVVPTEEGSMVRMPELIRERSIVNVLFELFPLTGIPTPAPAAGAVAPGTAENSELRSKLVSWSPPAMPGPATVVGGELMSSLLGVRVGVVSIWLRTSGMDESERLVS